MACIYIVEDDTDIREIETIALRNSGHTVADFDSGRAFFHKVEEKVPDLALLDIMLPDMDGYEIVKKLRSNPGTKRLPVIMVTAKTTEIDMIKGLDIGADDYIKKPFSVMERCCAGPWSRMTASSFPWGKCSWTMSGTWCT